MVNDVKMQGSSVQKIDKRMKKCLEKCSALNDKL